MSMEQWWNDGDGAEIEIQGEKPASFQFYAP
jgi:hypothetical protein